MIIKDKEFVKYEVAEEIDDSSDPRYVNSVFLPLKQLSSKTKGAKFEEIVGEAMNKQGHSVNKSVNGSDSDRSIDDLNVEIKGSFLWKGTNTFRFQQIRNQDYDVIIFLFVYPDRMSIRAALKEDVMNIVTQQDEEGNYPYNQHGGKKVDSGTYFMDATEEEMDFLVEIKDIRWEK